MFSKIRVIGTITVFAAMLASGCNLLNQEPPLTGFVAAGNFDPSCLNKVPQRIADSVLPEGVHLSEIRALLPELMQLKAALFGGDATSLSREEINHLQATLSVLHQEALAFLPFQSFSFSDLKNWSDTRVDALAAVLMQSSARLGGHTRIGFAQHFQYRAV